MGRLGDRKKDNGGEVEKGDANIALFLEQRGKVEKQPAILILRVGCYTKGSSKRFFLA